MIWSIIYPAIIFILLLSFFTLLTQAFQPIKNILIIQLCYKAFKFRQHGSQVAVKIVSGNITLNRETIKKMSQFFSSCIDYHFSLTSSRLYQYSTPRIFYYSTNISAFNDEHSIMKFKIQPKKFNIQP